MRILTVKCRLKAATISVLAAGFLLFPTAQPADAQLDNAKRKAEIAQAISERTYLIKTPIKPIIVYFGSHGRGVEVLANGEKLSFHGMVWGIRGVSGGDFGPCWTGHGNGNKCAGFSFLSTMKSYSGDKFQLTRHNQSPELKALLRY